MPAPDRPTHDSFRPDLEGLRGVAILLVVLFHAGVAWASGGYVGVDVFFVLSGFLITGLLIRERERTGSIDLWAFYARRARRILPAAAVVLLATLAAAWVALDPLAVSRAAQDAAAAALSIANIRFATQATDYFAATAAPSPILHYWSLGVEEQFYLVWPTLLLLAARGQRPRLGAAIVLGVLLVASFVAALALTTLSAPWAFYSLPTRAWQLALGGLVAVGARRVAQIREPAAAGLSWLGLAAIVASLLLIDSGTPYPGTAALLPSLGAAAVLVGGGRARSAGTLLVRGPIRFLGRISYSLYLVHWPVLVLPAASLAAGQELPPAERAGLVVLAVILATLSWRFVEQPIHTGHRFSLPHRRTLALATAAIAATVVVAVGVDASASREIDSYLSTAAAAGGTGGTAGAPGASPSEDLSGLAGSSSPTPPSGTSRPTHSTGPGATPGGSPPASSRPGPSQAIAPPPPPSGSQPLPAGVRPPLRQASTDLDLLERNGCAVDTPVVQPSNCVYGDPHGSTVVALVGDSHAAQFFPPLQRIADARGWKLVPFTKLSCRFFDMRIYSRVLKREYTECETWRQLVLQRLQSLKPDLTLVVATAGMATMSPADNDQTRQGEAMARMLEQIPGKVGIIVDTPQSQFDVPTCISGHLLDVRPCDTPRSYAFYLHYTIERTAARISGAALIDLSNWVCPGDPCPVLLNGMIVYRDSFHLTATFSASLARPLAALLPALDPAPPQSPSPSPLPGAPAIVSTTYRVRLPI